MHELRYEIWLSLLFPFGSEKPDMILKRYASAKTFYELDREAMRQSGLFTAAELRRIKATPLDRADEILKECEAKRIHAVSIRSSEFPENLRAVYAPPIVLYYCGKLELLKNCVPITVVGTRKPIPYCERLTRLICKSMARAGAVIVSGFALGIDEAAHRGALDAKGKTVAVLACGIDVNYPKEHYELKREILKAGGLLLSEIPPGLPMSGAYFPVRNRLLAGLSMGIFVPQAPMRSGALITVEHGLEQGKDIFCLPPYNITDSACMGVMRYIRDGCAVVAGAEDILMDYYFRYPDRLRPAEILRETVTLRDADRTVQTPEAAEPAAVEPQTARPVAPEQAAALPDTLSDGARKLYAALPRHPFPVAALEENPDFASADLLSLLLELELYTLVEKMQDGQYRKQ